MFRKLIKKFTSPCSFGLHDYQYTVTEILWDTEINECLIRAVYKCRDCGNTFRDSTYQEIDEGLKKFLKTYGEPVHEGDSIRYYYWKETYMEKSCREDERDRRREDAEEN